MSDETYTKCPITEALFDVRVTLSKDFDYRKFEDYYDSIKEEFSTKEVSVQYESSIAFHEDVDPVVGTKVGPIGFHFKSANGKRIVQFRKNGFTFNKLKPYDNWDSFFEEAKKHFEKFIEISTPVSIDRLGLRYINKLDIPLPIADFQEYVKTVPNIDSELPQSMVDFFMRLVVPENDQPDSNVAIITEAVDRKMEIKDVLPLIFDIDVFRMVKLTPTDTEEIYEIFNGFRDYKNRIFSNSLTEKMKTLIR